MDNGDPEGALLFAFATALRAAPFHTGTVTSVSAALEYSARLFEQNNIDSIRRVIDISADGTNTHAPVPQSAPDIAVEQGTTINGLVILSETPLAWTR